MFLSHWDAPGARLVVPLGPSEYICSHVPRHALGFSVSGQPTPTQHTQLFLYLLSPHTKKNVAMSPLSKPLHFLTTSEIWHRVGEHFGVTHEPTVQEKGQREVFREAAELGSPCKRSFGSDQTLNDLKCSGGHFPPRTSIFYKMKMKLAHILSQGWYSHTMRLRMQAYF